ncbi:MAG: ATP-binding protein [Lachnospiraceae bacterium]|nr:ATP-binding protein [Lachnospiraceae bacterium]
MFKRKIMADLISWKNETGRKKALVIKGLRQIGKTYIVKAFAEANYKSVVYIDFKRNISAKKVFDGDLTVNRITLDLSALFPEARFVAGETLLIFDEVQECSSARASVKSFIEDGRYDVICTGSLLGIKGYNRKKGAGVPVGFERIIYMKPMDFEEFLWAKGISKEIIAYLKDCYDKKLPVREAVHTAMLRYFREYICVGGLPYVVDRFLTTNDMNVVLQEQRDIIEEYKDDFGKHLDENEREETDLALLARINRVFDSIPAQLAKENKKFAYSMLEKKGRSENYQAAIQWLSDAGMINICFNLYTIDEPLSGYKIDNIFKLYMQDSGLFVAMLEQGSAARILSGELGFYKGAIFENIIADCFSKMDRELFYFHKDSGLEIDFVTKESGEITLIEVKATTGNTKSADTVLKNKERYHAEKCIKLSENNIGVAGNKITLPYYMAFLLKT